MHVSALLFQRLIFTFFIFINLTALAIILYTGQLSGDVANTNVSISKFTLICIGFVGVTLFFLFQMFGRIKLSIKSVDSKNLLIWVEILICISLALKLSGFIIFGYGAAESRTDISFGFIFRLIPTYILFIMLFLLPSKLKARHIAYVLIHVLTMLAMGWTGGLFDIFWLVIFRMLKQGASAKKLYIFAALVVVAFMFAPYIYAIKFYIRWGDQFEFSYIDVLAHLLSRLSYFPSVVFTFQSGSEFEHMASQYLLSGFTFFDSLTSVLPRSLLGIDLQNLETLFVKLVTGGFNPGVVFYLSLPGKLIVAANISTLEFLVTLIMFLSLSFVLLLTLKIVFGIYALVPWSLITYKWYLSGSFEEPTYYLYGLLLILLLSRIKLIRNRNINV